MIHLLLFIPCYDSFNLFSPRFVLKHEKCQRFELKLSLWIPTLDHSYDTDLHFKDTKKSSLLFWSSCNICRFPGGQVPLGNPPRIWAYYTTICRDMSLSFCKWISISTEILRNCLLLAEKKARILKTAVAFSDCGGAREPSIGIWRKMERNSFSSRLIMIQNSRNVS